MRIWMKASLTFGLSVLLLTLSCEKKGTEPELEPEVIISENTYIVEEGGPVTLESIDSTTFTFSYIGDAPDIETGDVFVGSEDGGYFRKALAVTFQDNQIIIETEDAALVEAILQGSFHIIDTLDWNSANLSGDGDKQGKITGGDGVELLPNGTIEFSNLPIFSDNYLNIFIAEGSLSFTPVIDIDGDIDFPGILREFHALATGTIDVYADFNAISSRDYSISHEITIPGAQYEFGPYFVSISGFPLWYSYELSIVAGFDYTSNAALETQHGFRNYASLTVGARYENGDWEAVFDPTLELTAREVIWDQSENVTLKCYIKPTITMTFYSSIGPYLDASPYLELDGVVDYPQWQYDLKAGLESSLGIRVRFLSFELVDFNTVLYSNEVVIASESGSAPINSPPDQPSNPSPPDSSEDQSVLTVLEWLCSDPDGDPLTYEVYFDTTHPPPYIQDQTNTDYNPPGELENGTTYYWQIIAKDAEYETEGQIWNFTTTEEQGGIFFVGSYNTPGLARDVFVSDRYAYVADNISGLQIIDIDDPSNPTFTGSYDTPGHVDGVFISGNYAYVGDGEFGLKIIDIANPSSPFVIGNYNTPDYAVGVYITGNYAYVGDDNSLQIINISNPSNPTYAGSCNTPDNGWRVFVAGDFAFVGSGSGLHVINISNPSNPNIISTYDTPDMVTGVHVSGNFAYLANRYAGLQIIDISNPANPEFTASYSTPDRPFDVHILNNYAYLADGFSGLQIINIAEPDNPTFAGSYDIPDVAIGIYVIDNYVYIANGFAGLQILRFVP